ncbi:rhodanese-like domain-containing protein [Puniceicoccaceae bacterium K14]|nr:rhodanese-like domain-containing protein [Puniceicoccaceae bacterium K14]
MIYCLISFVAGWIVFAVNPMAEKGLDDSLLVSLEDIDSLDTYLWIDARLDEVYAEGHYEGAILLNEESWEEGFMSLLDQWLPDQAIMVYCSSEACLRSHHVASRLREELGFEEVFVLEGGWDVLQNR